jgi:hypothetical protein
MGDDMIRLRQMLGISTAIPAVLALGAAPVAAQAKAKPKPEHTQSKDHSAISIDLALSATKDVLVKQGFEVVRIETQGEKQIVYYRAGNQGKGQGKGPPMRMVVQRVSDRIVIEDAPDDVKLEIGIKLGIKL